MYARMADTFEAKGGAEHRRELLAGASGQVLEIGAGTGLNFRHYPDTVTEVLAVEPEAYLRARAERAGVAGNREYNNGWHTAIDVGNMLVVSEAITRAALLRKESRGAQFREDFPVKDPEWGVYNIIIRRGSGGEILVEKRALPPVPDELKAVIEEMK